MFQLSGLLILAMGLWTILDKHHYVSLLSSNTYVATTYLLIATGGFILIVGIFGCCGARKENRICLMAVRGASVSQKHRNWCWLIAYYTMNLLLVGVVE